MIIILFGSLTKSEINNIRTSKRVMSFSGIIIRESVDPLCRDGADAAIYAIL